MNFKEEQYFWTDCNCGFNIEILLAISRRLSNQILSKITLYAGSIKENVLILLCVVYYKWNAVETWKHPCNDWGYGLCYVVPVNLYCGSIQSSSRRGGTTSKVLQRRDYDRWYKHAGTTGSWYFYYSPPLLHLLTLKTYFTVASLIWDR